LNLVNVRNIGVGFAFKGEGGTTQQWALAGFAAVITVALLVMQARAKERLYAAGLILIASGAIGNAICRLARGSVVDFIDVHVSDYHWPAFNVADMAITIGAFCVIAHALPLQRAIARLRAPRRGR
ncbi:MAG: signal peptidase II, partial [Rhodospirillales bacterium]|nr:signal peptidase II [Rhodospirillales bacterium]